jgi:two-component system chemotaxis sensor kinase CheA
MKQKYIDTFIFECNEFIDTVNDILNSITEYDKNKLNLLYRKTHTLKGNSSTLKFKNISLLSHNFETFLSKILNKEIQFNNTTLSLFYEWLEIINKLVISIKKNNYEYVSPTLNSEIKKFLELFNNNNNVNVTNKFVIQDKPVLPIYIYNKIKNIPIPLFYFFIKFKENVPALNLRILVTIEKIKKEYELIFLYPDIKTIEQETFIPYISGIIKPDSKNQINGFKQILDSIIQIDNYTIKKINIKNINEYFQIKSRRLLDNILGHELEYIKIKTDELDNIISLINEITINNLLIENKINFNIDSELKELFTIKKSLINRLLNKSFNLRLISINRLFSKLNQIIKTNSEKLGKSIKLIVKGEHTQIDKNLILRLQEPILHIIRNCIDHGIETPEQRRKLNKNSIGTIRVSAKHKNNKINIEISDDGKGFDIQKIRDKIIEKKLVDKNKIVNTDDKTILDYVFTPGFTTSEYITDISGRGVGMDVVKNEITKLKGTIKIDTAKNKGSKFYITIPVSLSLIDCLICHTGNFNFCVSLNSILDTVSINKTEIIQTKNNIYKIYYDNFLIPYYPITDFLDFNYLKPDINFSKNNVSVLITEYNNNKIGIGVDNISAQENIIIKEPNKFLKLQPYIIGLTILGTGEPGTVIDLNKLISLKGVLNVFQN